MNTRYVTQIMCIFVLIAFALPARASTSLWSTAVSTADLTGSRFINGGGLTGIIDKWTTGTIAWNISKVDADTWSYSYTLTTTKKQTLSHLLLEFTNPVQATDISGTGTSTYALSSATGWNINGHGNANGALSTTALLYGFKIAPDKDDSSSWFLNTLGQQVFTFSFLIDRSPVWGSIFLKGGRQNFVYNQGLVGTATDSALSWIARPDGVSAVPIPAASLLLVPVLLGMAWARQMRRV